MSQIPNYPPPLTVSNVPPVPRSRFKSGCACGGGTSLLIFFLILCFGLTLQSSSTSSANRVVISGPDSPFKDDCDKVAVIKINEAIMETDGFIYDQIEDVKEDSTPKTPCGSLIPLTAVSRITSRTRSSRRMWSPSRNWSPRAAQIWE